MRRYARPLLLAAAVTALVGLASASADAGNPTMRTLCTACGSLQTARGAGILRVAACGVTWGTVRYGRIIVKDRSANGKRDWSVTGWERRRRLSSGRTQFFGHDMRVYISTRYTVTVRGRGLSTGTVARGRSYVRGAVRSHGSYHLNGGRARRWPLSGRTLVLKR